MPPGHQVLEVATSAATQHFAALRHRDPERYRREKLRMRDRILDILEERYVPGLAPPRHARGRHATDQRTFCRAPHGNAYGSALTP